MKKVYIHLRPPHIHWRLYFTRKIITMGIVVAVVYVLGYMTGSHLFFRGGEFALGTLLEHCIFGVPFEEA